MAFKDLTGKQFGRLTVIEVAGKTSSGSILWLCLCICGKTSIVRSYSLRIGETKSCGCLQPETAAARICHGDARHGKFAPEYQTWKGMIQRCINPRAEGYQYYGGRGIRICDSWLHSYEAFLADVGRRPNRSFTLDRINNDGDYEPGNVRWATHKEQALNKRKTLRLRSLRGKQCVLKFAS